MMAGYAEFFIRCLEEAADTVDSDILFSCLRDDEQLTDSIVQVRLLKFLDIVHITFFLRYYVASFPD